MAKKTDISEKKAFSGERNALKGYEKQYHEFARRIYPCVNDKSLVKIQVAAIKHTDGNLDDIWYETSDAVHAYQIKTSSVSKPFGYAEYKQLLPRIVLDWLDDKVKYSTKKVIPYLWTDRPISKDSPVETKGGKTVGYFPEFLDEAASRLKQRKKIEAKWKPIIEEIRADIAEKVGGKLTKEEWQTFWKNFNFAARRELKIITRKQALTDVEAADILALADMIREMASNKDDHQVERKREEIVHELIWDDRFKTKYNHNLKVDTATYVPIESVLAELDNQLNAHEKGYIFLEGVPGSGKSTILTQWTRTLSRYVRFYAFDFTQPSHQFVNDAMRGDGVTFLYDLIKSIREKGYAAADQIPPIRDEYFLKEALRNAMDAMSEYYKATKEKTVILVDGLDHVYREYKTMPHASLLQMLPSTKELPKGVVFVLGSQYYDCLGLCDDVLNVYETSESVVKMPNFTEVEVGRLARLVLGDELVTDALLRDLNTKSSGNPLCLRYILNQIKADPDIDLNEMPDYEKNIANYYHRIARNITDFEENRRFLGLLARVVGGIKDEFVREWGIHPATLRAILKDMGYLFYHNKISKTRTFFHNSFRQYVLKETTYDYISEDYREEEDVRFYVQLAQLMDKSKVESGWNVGGCLFVGGADEAYERMVTPERLFKEIQSFRPIWHVFRDMDYMAQIAVRNKDAYLMARVILLHYQIMQMSNQAVDEKVIVADLVQLGELEIAKRLIQDGDDLHCNIIAALNFAREFYKYGDIEEATFLFESSTPELVIPTLSMDHHRKEIIEEYKEMMMDWVHTAMYIKDIQEVDEHIEEAAKALSEEIKDEDETGLDDIMYDVRYQKIVALIELERYDEIEDAINAFHPGDQIPTRCGAYRDLLNHLLKNDTHPEKQQLAYAELRKFVDANQGVNRDWLCLDMAVWGQQVGADKETIAKDMEQVSWDKLNSISYMMRSSERFDALHQRIHYVEMRTYLGFDDKLEDLVPMSTRSDNTFALVEYLRMVYHVAQLRMKAYRQGQTDKELIGVVKKYLRFFDAYKYFGSNEYAFMFSRHRGEFYEYLVTCAAEYGKPTVQKVRDVVQDMEMNGKWNADAKDVRSIVSALYEAGVDKDWTEMMLNRVEERMFEGDKMDIHERQMEALMQGRAWKMIGNKEKAMLSFQTMMTELFGVDYRKDHQPAMMASWICDVNKYDTQHAVERIHWLTSRLKAVETRCEHRTAYLAGRRLMKGVCSMNMGMGVQLGQWLKANEYCSFQTVSAVLVEALLGRDLSKMEYDIVFQYFTQVHLAAMEWHDDDSDALERILKVGERIVGEKFGSYKEVLKNSISRQCMDKAKGPMLSELENIENPKPKQKSEFEEMFGRKRETEIYCEKAEELLAKGKKDEAWKNAMEALRRSTPMGWASYYDGGTRLKACKVLKEINAEDEKRIAMLQLADDLHNGASYGALNDLEEIVGLLTDEIDHKKLFAERFGYMNRILREDTVNEEDKPELTKSEDGVEEIMKQWLAFAKGIYYNRVFEKADMMLDSIEHKNVRKRK